jgi:hypothetical protein
MADDTNAGASERNGSVWEPVAWLVFAGVVLYMTLDFDAPLPTFKFGAAFWPQVIVAIIAVAGCILLASRYIKGRERTESGAEAAFFEDTSVPDRLSPLTLAMFVLPMIWVYGMHKIGFLLATPFFLLAFTWLMGVRKPVKLIGFSFGFYAVLVLVFYTLIFTPLPMGAGAFNALNGEILALIQ